MTKLTFWQFIDWIHKDQPILRILLGSKILKTCFLLIAFDFGFLIGLKDFRAADSFPLLWVFGVAWFLDNMTFEIKEGE